MSQVAAAFHSSGDAAAVVGTQARRRRRRRGFGKLASPPLAKLTASAKRACRDLTERRKSLAQLEALLVQETHRLPAAQGLMQWARALAGKKRQCFGPQRLCVSRAQDLELCLHLCDAA